MFFAKGEIIMNNIYKVIWSKAKNCYVVASEIAKSHTKSASGQSVRRSALASLLALSLLCGGLGVASAVDVVHVDESATGTAEVYTKTGVDTLLNDKADKTALGNKADATEVVKNTTNIATNKENIAQLDTKKLDKEVANSTFATKDALNDLEDAVNNKVDESAVETALDGKADKTYVDTAVADAVTKAGTNVDTKLADYAKTVDVYNKTEVDGKIVDEENARNTAITAAITQEKDDRNAAINTAINGEVTNRNQAIDNAITQEVTDRNAAVTNAKAELQAKITAEETARTNADTAFNTRLTTAEGKIGANETAIGELKAKDTELEGKITTLEGSGVKYDTAVKDKITLAGAGGTTITHLKDATLSDSSTDAVTGKQLNKTNENLAAEETARTNKDMELEGKINTLDGNVTTAQGDINDLKAKDIELEGRIHTNEGNIETNKNAIAATDKRTGGITRNDAASETTIEGHVTVDNLGNVKAKGDVTADGKLKGEGVDAGDGAITTTGAVNAGSLNVTDASHLKGDVTMDKTLSVTGDTSLGALNVTGESSLKNTQVNGTLTTTGKATFKEAVDMDKGLTVTSGDTTLQNTDVKGALNVTGESSLKDTQVNGTLTTTGKATFKEAVDMDKGLTVTNGDTTLQKTNVNGALNVTGESNLKNTTVGGTLGVTGETTLSGELKAEKDATFGKDVTVKGTTNLGNTTVDGNLKVTGTITTDKMVFGDKATNNYTEIDKGHITSKNDVLAGDATKKSSSMELDHSKLEVGVTDKDSNGHLTMTADQTSIKNSDLDGKNYSEIVADKDSVTTTVKDEKANTTSTKSSATEIRNYAKDKDGNKTNNVQTATQNKSWAKDKDGNESSIVQTGKDITNTAQSGTITNDAQNIVNNATGDMTNTVGGKLTTTVAGQATEEFNGGLNTTVTGTENHTVNGKQINTVTEGQENIISGGQTNTITGGQINNITGDQTTTITGNKTEIVTENVTEDYKKNLTTTVGGNEIHEVKGTKTETVEGKLTENFKGGQETNVTGDQTTNVSGTQTTTATDINRNASSGMIDTIDNDYGTNTETKVAGKTTTDVSIKGTGEEGKYIRGANESRDYLIKGTLKNTETKTVEKTSTEITDGNGNTSATIQDKTQISGSVTNGTSSAVSNVKADSIDTAVKEGTNTSLISQKKDSITSAVGNSTTSTVIQQGDKDITIASNGGTVGIAGKDIINNATNEITNTAGTKITDKVGNNTRVIDQTSITDTVGTASRKIEDGKITDTAGDSTVTTENGKGTTFAKAGSAAYSTEAGAPTDTNIAGNHITTGRVDVNELGVSDKDDQGNTADFSVKAGEGIKGSATDKDGNKTYTKVTATENSFQVQDKDGNIKNHQVNTKDKSENTIKNGDKTNTVTSTADGTTFNNSEAAAPVTGASGDGTEVKTTIKGNTITTGKVTMDYAEVMKDLGVRGNANIAGKTTTGSLEVKGESKLTGDVTMESNATVKKDLTVEGNTNLKNTKVDGTLDVTQKATFGDSVSIAKDLSVDGNATIKGDVTASSYKVGDKTYISAAGINANDQKITNVADGSISEGSKDAVNGGQLYTVKNDFEGKVNKVGANAAAMANLHPMEFDPDSKWNIAAAIGNYGSETAAALGAFYRPNDDVMVNLSTAFGTGENMVGGGVSVRLGKGGNKLSREENNALKAQVDNLTARMNALLSVLNPNMSKDFPDVPENHWAYEAVSRLAGNDIVQGYPDGEFHGERTMTRYEMAEIIYNALSRGAEAEKELVEEFKPELQAMAASEKATAEKAEG